jgi:hypothetical protein
MSNRLIDKYFELYPEKIEEPKPTKPPIVEYYDEVGSIPSKEVIEKLRQLQPNSKVISSSGTSLTSYDTHSTEDSFFQVAELMKNGTARVISMRMNTDAFGGFYTGKRTVTFEVDIWDSP